VGVLWCVEGGGGEDKVLNFLITCVKQSNVWGKMKKNKKITLDYYLIF